MMRRAANKTKNQYLMRQLGYVASVIGPNGPNGPTGPTGTTGTFGCDFPFGYTGSIGKTGSLGHDGPTGPTGPVGDIGDTGCTGYNGEIGPTGPQGMAGPYPSIASAFITIEIPTTQAITLPDTTGQSFIKYSGQQINVTTNNTLFSVPVWTWRNSGTDSLVINIDHSITGRTNPPIYCRLTFYARMNLGYYFPDYLLYIERNAGKQVIPNITRKFLATTTNRQYSYLFVIPYDGTNDGTSDQILFKIRDPLCTWPHWLFVTDFVLNLWTEPVYMVSVL